MQLLFSPSARLAYVVGAPFAMGSAFGVAPGQWGRWKLGKSLGAVGTSTVPSLSGCVILELQMGCRCVLCHM